MAPHTKKVQFLTALTTNINRGYERKLGGSSGSCYDTDDNTTDFQLLTPSDQQDLSSAFTYCAGSANCHSHVNSFANADPYGDQHADEYLDTNTDQHINRYADSERHPDLDEHANRLRVLGPRQVRIP